MPYHIEKRKNGCQVVDNSGKAYSKEPIPCERAKAQLRAIQANSQDGHTGKSTGKARSK